MSLIWVIEQLVLRIWMRDNHVSNLIEAGCSLTVLGQGEGPVSGEAEDGEQRAETVQKALDLEGMDQSLNEAKLPWSVRLK